MSELVLDIICKNIEITDNYIFILIIILFISLVVYCKFFLHDTLIQKNHLLCLFSIHSEYF